MHLFSFFFSDVLPQRFFFIINPLPPSTSSSRARSLPLVSMCRQCRLAPAQHALAPPSHSQSPSLMVVDDADDDNVEDDEDDEEHEEDDDEDNVDAEEEDGDDDDDGEDDDEEEDDGDENASGKHEEISVS